MGVITLAKFDEDQIIVKGYLKPKLVKAIDVFHPILNCSNNDEYYLFNSKKYHNIISLLGKVGVPFVDETLQSDTLVAGTKVE